MLVLSRQRDETIKIGQNIDVTIVAIKGDRVRVGISAPHDVPVHRKEIFDEILSKQGEQALSMPPQNEESPGAMYRGPYSTEINRILGKQVRILQEATRKGSAPEFPEQYRSLCEEMLDLIRAKNNDKQTGR